MVADGESGLEALGDVGEDCGLSMVSGRAAFKDRFNCFGDIADRLPFRCFVTAPLVSPTLIPFTTGSSSRRGNKFPILMGGIWWEPLFDLFGFVAPTSFSQATFVCTFSSVFSPVAGVKPSIGSD